MVLLLVMYQIVVYLVSSFADVAMCQLVLVVRTGDSIEVVEAMTNIRSHSVLH